MTSKFKEETNKSNDADEQVIRCNNGKQYTITTHEKPSCAFLEVIVTFLRTSASWDTHVNDLLLCLHASPVAELFTIFDERNSLVATAILTQTRENAYWIGHVVVDTAHRRCGLGTALMTTLLKHYDRKQMSCQSPLSLNLVATSQGATLYPRFKFASMGKISAKLQTRPKIPPPDLQSYFLAEVVEHTTDRRHESAVLLYNSVVQANRTGVLNALFGMDKLCTVVRKEGKVRAAAWGRFYNPFDEPVNTTGVFIGPVVADDEASMRAVVIHMLHLASKRLQNRHDGQGVPLVASMLSLAFVGQRRESLFVEMGFSELLTCQYMGLNDGADSLNHLDLVQCDQSRYFSLMSYDQG